MAVVSFALAFTQKRHNDEWEKGIISVTGDKLTFVKSRVQVAPGGTIQCLYSRVSDREQAAGKETVTVCEAKEKVTFKLSVWQ